MLALRRASIPLRNRGFSFRASSASFSNLEIRNTCVQEKGGSFNVPTSRSDVGMSLTRFFRSESDSTSLFVIKRSFSSQVSTNLLNKENTGLIESQGNTLEPQDSSEMTVEEQKAHARNLIKKFANLQMKGGKKTKVRNILYKTFHRVAQTERDVMSLVSEAVENVKPLCQVERVGVAGTIYDVPGLVSKKRQKSLAVRWIIDAASKRRVNNKIALDKCLFSELQDAYRKKGVARKKREGIHKVASNNRSFAHFRWW